MSTEVIIAIASIVVIVLVGWILVRQPNPDEAADHEPSPETPGGPTEEPYPPGSRPAGPGAESQDPDAGADQPPKG